MFFSDDVMTMKLKPRHDFQIASIISAILDFPIFLQMCKTAELTRKQLEFKEKHLNDIRTY